MKTTLHERNYRYTREALFAYALAGSSVSRAKPMRMGGRTKPVGVDLRRP